MGTTLPEVFTTISENGVTTTNIPNLVTTSFYENDENSTTLSPFTESDYNTTIIELSTILMQNLTTMFPNYDNFTTDFPTTTEPTTTPFVFTGNISDYSEY